MENCIFTVGDRVAATAILALKERGNPIEGARVTVVAFDGSYLPYLVKFDEEFENGHRGRETYANQMHYWCDEKELILVQEDNFELVYESIFDVLEQTKG